jgi:hypothetical protein
LIFDQNNEKFQPDIFSEEPPEKAKPLAGTSSAGPDGQEINPSLTLSAKPNETANLQLDSSPVRTDEQVQPHLDPSLMRAAQQQQTAAAVSPMTAVEPAKPFAADKSATNSLMEVIVPAENSKTEPVVSALNQTHKKIIAVGGAKGGGSANLCYRPIWRLAWLF